MKIDLPEKVKWIMNKLNEANFAAYVVGGSVRDSLLGKEPKDWDIATDATPDEVESLFYTENNEIDLAKKKMYVSTIPTGKKFGTITIKIQDVNEYKLSALDKLEYTSGTAPDFIYNIQPPPYLFEVTTFRDESNYNDGRRPEVVNFSTSLKEDVKRRDFTINSMALNIESEIIDYYNGQRDLENKIIKCVGNAEERFNEDALRILRAIRFALKLDFTIEKDTLAKLMKLFPNLEKISKERILEEMRVIFNYSLNYDFLKVVLFWLNIKEEKVDLWEFNKRDNFIARLLYLFNTKDITPALLEVILREIKLTNNEIKTILKLFRLSKEKVTKELIRKTLNDNEIIIWQDWHQTKEDFSIFPKTYNIENLSEQGINGEWLMNEFNIQGIKIRETLENLIEYSIKNKILMTKDVAIKII